MGSLMTPGGDVPLTVKKVYTDKGKLCLDADVGDWGDSVLEISAAEIWPVLRLAFKGEGVVPYAVKAFFSGGKAKSAE